MKNTSLIKILKTFSTAEIKEFGEFVRSGFFNKNESVIRLYDYIRKFHPDYDESKIEKENVHKKLFQGTKYNDGFLRKLIFNLTNLAEKYMAYKSSTADPVESGIDLLAELNRRRLDKQFTKHFSDIEKINESADHKNHIYYRRKFALEVQWTTYIDIIRYKVDLHDKKEYHNERMREKFFLFTNYYLFYSLNIYSALKYQGYGDRFDFSDEFMDNVIKYLLDQLNEHGGALPARYTDNLMIRVYLYEIMLIKNNSAIERLPQDTYFLKLKEILINETENLIHDARFSLYNILLQHCANRIMRGYSEYRRERFELDKIALSQGIYKSVIETNIPSPAFATMVRDSSEMKEFEWAMAFIKKYKNEIETNNDETVLNLSYAVLYFNKGEFEKALDHLNKIKAIKRWEFKFAVKELTLLVFYELSMFTQAYYLIDSFRHFITSMSRNFSEDRIESRTNFLKYYSRLLKLKENPEGKELKNILNELGDNNILIFNRDWLGEKADELKKGLK